MNISKTGLDLIKSFESLRLNAYLCPAGVLTIGYGHTGKDVNTGNTITEERADELLAYDVSKFEKGVSGAVHIDLTQNQFDALVSLAFNIGLSAFTRSTLLRKLNQGDLEGAALEFLRWNRASGKILIGLVRRRDRERYIFNMPEGDYR